MEICAIVLLLSEFNTPHLLYCINNSCRFAQQTTENISRKIFSFVQQAPCVAFIFGNCCGEADTFTLFEQRVLYNVVHS